MSGPPPPVPPPLTPAAIAGLPFLLGQVLAIPNIADDIAEYAFMDLQVCYAYHQSLVAFWYLENAFRALNIPHVVPRFRFSRPTFVDASEMNSGHFDTPYHIRQQISSIFLEFRAQRSFIPPASPPAPAYSEPIRNHGIDWRRLYQIADDFPAADHIIVEIAFNQDDITALGFSSTIAFEHVLCGWIASVRDGFLQRAASGGVPCEVSVLLTDYYRGQQPRVGTRVVDEAYPGLTYYPDVAVGMITNMGRVYRII